MSFSISKLFTFESDEQTTKSPSSMCIKRLQSDIAMICHEPIDNVDVYVDEDNILIWYFMISGFDDPYKYGYYIGRIVVNPDYPMKPPISYKFFTPSGRFNIGEKICMSNSSYHNESWNPLWNMKTIILGIISIFWDVTEHGVAYIHYSDETKRILAIQSSEYNKKKYFDLIIKFLRLIKSDGSPIKPIDVDKSVLDVVGSTIIAETDEKYDF
jgi:ubiquitin-protein ligase